MAEFELTVDETFDGLRVDAYLVANLENINRSKLKSGLVSLAVNNKVSKLSKAVKTGDVINVVWENPIPDSLVLSNVKLKIAFEDENIIVVNKPSGMVTHPAPGHYKNTLVNALEYYRREVSDYKDEFSALPLDLNESSLRRGIVHRLDKDTSGLIITARNEKTQAFFKNEFKRRKIKKYYFAIVKGVPKETSGFIKTSIFRAGKNSRRFRASSDLSKGRIAYSRYRVLKTVGDYSVLMFRIYTGRTHQIRVHSKFLGMPVVGDKIYSKDSTNKLMLHAGKVVFTSPTGEQVILKAKMPRRFYEFLNRVK